MQVLGLDIGFGFTKVANRSENLMFKSLIGNTEEIQFKSKFSLTPQTESLHVTVDGEEYFIGDYAEKQSTVRHYTLEQDKLTDNFLKVLSLTAVGLLTDKYVPLKIVSGLPVLYFGDYNERYRKILGGHHEITYHRPDGQEIQRRLNISKIRMIPQPYGSMMNILLDDRGKVVNRELAGQKVGVVDIGFNTTDYILIDKLEYINRGSKTINLGISDCFRQIADKIRQKSGLTIDLYRLYHPLENGTIKLKGQNYNLSKIKEQVFMETAKVIANEVNQAWADDWDMDTIVLTGGGSSEMAEYIKPLLNGTIILPEPGQDIRANNVQGFMKYARHLWDIADVDPQAVPPNQP
jgi:plasmid segregation protein ParM